MMTVCKGERVGRGGITGRVQWMGCNRGVLAARCQVNVVAVAMAVFELAVGSTQSPRLSTYVWWGISAA